MLTLAPPVVLRSGSDDSAAPLVVLLHGRGDDAPGILGLADRLPVGPQYLALRAPLALDSGYTWFENRGLGRPVPESLAATSSWFRDWLDNTVAPECPVVLVGFSGGAAFAGGLLLADPGRFRSAALLCGTLPWDAGVPTDAGRLSGASVFCAMAERDEVMPSELMDRTWRYLAEDAGGCVTMRRYPGGHEIGPEMLADLGCWLAEDISGC